MNTNQGEKYDSSKQSQRLGSIRRMSPKYTMQIIGVKNEFKRR